MTKEELVSKMRFHRSEYEKLSDEWKVFQQEENLKRHFDKQKSRLETYKAQYKFYVQPDGAMREIDWDEVEKLLASWDGKEGYVLGFDEHGTCGLACLLQSNESFSAMVEDETEAARLVARYERIQSYKEKRGGTKA